MSEVAQGQEAGGVDILAILKNAGVNLTDANKAIREAKRDMAAERVEMLAKQKGGNKERLIKLAEEIRATLEAEGAELLDGSHLNFTVRKTDGKVFATANECHATGFVESIHITADGEVGEGKEFAEKAKNVRARKKSD